MRVSADNHADWDYRIVRKSDGVQVEYVVKADTEAGFYKRAVLGEDGTPAMTHRVVREAISADGKRTFYGEGGNECGEPVFLLEEVREPFQIVHRSTREVVAETSE